jgi:hypothetical protein
MWVLRFDSCLFCFFCRKFLWIWFFWFDCRSLRRKRVRDKKFFFEFVCFFVNKRVVKRFEFRKKFLREKKKIVFLKKSLTLKTMLRLFVRRIIRDFYFKSNLALSKKRRLSLCLVRSFLRIVFQMKDLSDLIFSCLILSLIVFTSEESKSCFLFSFSLSIVLSRYTSFRKKIILISFKIAKSSRRLKKLSQLKKSKKVINVKQSKKL